MTHRSSDDSLLVLSNQPRALHKVRKFGRTHQRIETIRVSDIQEALVLVLQEATLADPEVLAKMEELDDETFSGSSHRTRRYISRELDTIYLSKGPKFAKENSRQLFGYWFPTNIGFKELSAIFRLACKTAGIRGRVQNDTRFLLKFSK